MCRAVEVESIVGHDLLKHRRTRAAKGRPLPEDLLGHLYGLLQRHCLEHLGRSAEAWIESPLEGCPGIEDRVLGQHIIAPIVDVDDPDRRPALRVKAGRPAY